MNKVPKTKAELFDAINCFNDEFILYGRHLTVPELKQYLDDCEKQDNIKARPCSCGRHYTIEKTCVYCQCQKFISGDINEAVD